MSYDFSVSHKAILRCYFYRYFQAGGSPEHVIQLLSENYSAVAQTVNLLAEWLIQMGKLNKHPIYFKLVNHSLLCQAMIFQTSRQINGCCMVILFVCIAGVAPAQVQERVQNHLKSLLIKHFDPHIDDSLFTVAGEVRHQTSFSCRLYMQNL